MKYQTVLFDLDGTLTDPVEGITRSVAFALEHFGIREEDTSALVKFIGPPLAVSFPEFYGFSEEQTALAVEKYRERFSAVGWAENRLFPGVEELLAALKAAGRQLAVATSKPEVYAVRILEHFSLAGYFDHICGPALDAPKSYGKAEVIRDALARCGADPARSVMVGDRLHDVEGAHKAGIPCVGVLWGYGDREEHRRCGADHVAEDLTVLRALLLKEKE